MKAMSRETKNMLAAMRKIQAMLAKFDYDSPLDLPEELQSDDVFSALNRMAGDAMQIEMKIEQLKP